MAVDCMHILAVLGPGDAPEGVEEAAERVGALAARCGWVVLTGGGPGAMAAACRGAAGEGGLTVGVLPGARNAPAYPNPWVRLVLRTGLGQARNVVNVLSADLCVALGGGSGTLSEMAHALKAGREVWCWGSWGLTPPTPGFPLPRAFDDLDELLAALEARLGSTC